MLENGAKSGTFSVDKLGDTIKEFGKTTSDLKVIEKGEPIFLRLDANEEIEYIKNKMKE